MAYMVSAYLIIWIASFALILSMVLRQRKIDQELAVLEESLKEKQS